METKNFGCVVFAKTMEVWNGIFFVLNLSLNVFRSPLIIGEIWKWMDRVEWPKDLTEENGRRNGRRNGRSRRKKEMALQWDKVQVVEDKVVVVERSQEEKSDFLKVILIFLPS